MSGRYFDPDWMAKVTVPVKRVVERWEFFYDGGVPVRDSTIGELTVKASNRRWVDGLRLRHLTTSANGRVRNFMLPSLLARNIQTGLKHFLISGFKTVGAFMNGLMRGLADGEGALLKAPLVQTDLPFVQRLAVSISPASGELNTTIKACKL